MEGQDGFMALPRHAGRLTADIILNAPQGLNPCSEYELDLRSNKIGAIENLGATQNQFDAIDLSSNEIVKLEGFPSLPRLHTVTLCNNRIARIAVNLESSVPSLRALNLTNNRISSFSDVDALKGCSRLTHLSLVGNPVSKKDDYRLYVAFTLPNVTVLDFRKMKQAERDAAAKKFGGKNGDKALKSARAKANTFVPGEVVDAEMATADSKPTGPTSQQLLALKAAITNAATLEEVTRLEQAMTAGILPSDMKL